ncbi:uncharacterized protein [Dendrobates tinctorius]|uniref:uncharacterized protein isoform X2 n=1 Tax=Dendrobates tinctorius TaxID=92724 RepID=UPI003CC9A5B8
MNRKKMGIQEQGCCKVNTFWASAPLYLLPLNELPRESTVSLDSKGEEMSDARGRGTVCRKKGPYLRNREAQEHKKNIAGFRRTAAVTPGPEEDLLPPMDEIRNTWDPKRSKLHPKPRRAESDWRLGGISRFLSLDLTRHYKTVISMHGYEQLIRSQLGLGDPQTTSPSLLLRKPEDRKQCYVVFP